MAYLVAERHDRAPAWWSARCPNPKIPFSRRCCDKLELRRPLDSEDREAVLALPHRVIKFRPQEYIVREGDKPQN